MTQPFRLLTIGLSATVCLIPTACGPDGKPSSTDGGEAAKSKPSDRSPGGASPAPDQPAGGPSSGGSAGEDQEAPSPDEPTTESGGTPPADPEGDAAFKAKPKVDTLVFRQRIDNSAAAKLDKSVLPPGSSGSEIR